MTTYIQAPFGVFELRKGRPPKLYEKGRVLAYRKIVTCDEKQHDFSAEEIRKWVKHNWHWRPITADEAEQLIREQKP